MTKAQVSAMLNLLNTTVSDGTTVYKENQWIRCEEVAHFIVGTDENIYPDKTMQVYFDGTNELIATRTGRYTDEGEFKVILEPVNIIPYDELVGVQMVSRSHWKSPYGKGAMV